MEESSRNRTILILSILNVIFLLGMISSCVKGGQVRLARDKEIAIRFDSQENLDKVQKEKASLEIKLKKTEDALGLDKAGLESARKALVQEQQIVQGLRNEIERVNKLKEALEAELVKLKVTDKSGRSSKK